MWSDYISDLALSRLCVRPMELSEIAETREVFKALLGVLPPQPPYVMWLLKHQYTIDDGQLYSSVVSENCTTINAPHYEKQRLFGANSFRRTKSFGN